MERDILKNSHGLLRQTERVTFAFILTEKNAALQADGQHVGRKRVIRLMQGEQLRGRPHRRFRVTTQSDPQAACARKLLRQRFTAAAPNRIWTADITALPTAEGWLYLAVIRSLFAPPAAGADSSF